MATGQLEGVVCTLRKQARVREFDALPDAELLEHYLTRSETDAFSAIVRRHGPMVLGVCRRVLDHSHDAEDAFQATFLVLIRKAGSIRPRAMVGNWLYGVAFRIALKTKAMAATRNVKERAMARPETIEDSAGNELEQILDQELSRLPDNFRVPLVLCDLEGKSRKEAAHQLGWPEGTVAGRLARARALLAQRLTKRGVTLSIGALSAAMAQQTASASVPAPLVAQTVQLATTGPTGVLSAKALMLSEGMLKTMLLGKLKAVSACLLLVGALVMGTGTLVYSTWGAQPGINAADRSGESLGKDEKFEASPVAQPTPQPERERKPIDLNRMWSQGKAEGKGVVKFTHSPMRLEDIERILPYGLMVGGHVTPIDHGYFFPKKLKPDQEHFDVFAPADGFIVVVGHRVQLTGSSEKSREYDDYALIIEHSSTFYTQYDLLTSLDKGVLDRLDESVRMRFQRKQPGPVTNVRIPIKAGQVIGKVGGRSLDFGVVNSEVMLKGILTPSLYGHYEWRVHVVDPYDHFGEPLRSKLLKLNLRKAEPRGGKIDYDIDGKAVGNWFKLGTGGYAGNKDKRGYWMGHLALAYHPIDPSLVIVSVGDFDGKPRQFAVEKNGRDPAKVSAKDGIVKYELRYAPINNSGERFELPPHMAGVQGVLLVQVMEDRKLKAEAFPGKTAREVKDFTAGATIYER